MKLKYGQIIVSGYGQQMQDGSWSAKCVITDHAKAITREHTLIGRDNYSTQDEAIASALDIGRAWADENCPI
jgi:hypothetical protein